MIHSIDYQIIFFLDPYDVGVRDVIIKSSMEELVLATRDYFQKHPGSGFKLMEKTKFNCWKELPRWKYVEFSRKVRAQLWQKE